MRGQTTAAIAAALCAAAVAPAPAQDIAPASALAASSPAHARHRAHRAGAAASGPVQRAARERSLAAEGYLPVESVPLEPAPSGRSHEDGWPSQDVDMPFVRGGPPGVAERIDAYLYLDFMRSPAPGPAEKVFRLRGLPEGDTVAFSVLRDDARLLSFTFTIGVCGAHCEWHAEDRHFDPRNGRHLLLSDLLTPDGIAFVRAEQAHAGIAAYTEGLARLPPSPDDQDDDGNDPVDDSAGAAPAPARAASLPPIDPADYADVTAEDLRRFFRDCRSNWEHSLDESRKASDMPSVQLPAAGGLLIPVPACGHDPWHIRLETDIVVPDVVLDAASLARYLTAYGRYMVANGPPVPPPDAPWFQVLRGHVGAAPVTLRLDGKDGADGLIVYDRIGRPIDLVGTLQGDTLELREADDQRHRLTLRRNGAGLEGTWTDGSKRLPVRLE